MNSTLAAAALAVGALVLVAGSSGTPTTAHDVQRERRLDLTAAAHPTGAEPTVTDRAVHVSATSQRSVRAHATALASATCDGCRGDATALQVLYVEDAPGAVVENAAVAWAQCADCGGTALSVQVVVLAGGQRVTANNRALAAGAACRVCGTRALAYQLVVVRPGHERLSHRALRELRAWVARQAAALRHPAASSRRAPAALERRAAGGLQRLVNGDLDSRTREIHVKRG